MVGLLPQFFIEAVVNFIQWYELACRTKEFDEEMISRMEAVMERYVQSLNCLGSKSLLAFLKSFSTFFTCVCVVILNNSIIVSER